MAVPTLTWSITFQPGTNKLSRTSPYDTCTVKFSCDTYLKHFICRSTFEDETWGRNTGILIQEYRERAAGTELEFTISANTHLLHGETQEDGLYRIGMYGQSDNGEWNIQVAFYVGTSAFHVLDSTDPTKDIPLVYQANDDIN